MAPGVIPYDVNTPFWSDGAHVVRFFALPPTTDPSGAQVPTPIDMTDSGGWRFPDGTVALQSFAIESEEGRPESRRWIETRLMLKEQGEWAAYSYEWNDDQTDAELVAGEGKDRVFRVRTAARDAHPDGVREQPWRFQSRAECMACHSRAANYVLGLCTVQLNRDFDYKAALGDGHAADNQLRSLERIGVLRNSWWGGAAWFANFEALNEGLFGDAVADRVAEKLSMTREDLDAFAKRQSSLLAKSPAAINRLANPRDASRPLEARARSYLHANCSSCHMQAGGGNSLVHFNYLTGSFTKPLKEMHAIDEKPIHHTFDLDDPMIIASGHPERSVVISRISRRGSGQMPQLGTALVDEQAVQLLREWISSLREQKPAETSLSKAQP
ncbi:MAG: hypothetical protein EBZ59_04885 [Planctomycetia bacterium]|nr:hypothetical protein [Planctomycetia bacterium]